MRLISILPSIIVLAALAGCGGKSGPANVSAEEEQQLKEQQKQVDAEERQRMAKQPKALTQQQQVEVLERQQQRR
jgi:predicted small lipoprotein YifL